MLNLFRTDMATQFMQLTLIHSLLGPKKLNDILRWTSAQIYLWEIARNRYALGKM